MAWRRSQGLDKDLELDLEGILEAGLEEKPMPELEGILEVGLEEKPRAGQGSGAGSGRRSRGWPGGKAKVWTRIWSWIWKAFSRLAWKKSQGLDKDLKLDLEGIFEAGLEEKPMAGLEGILEAGWTRIWSWIWKTFSRLAWRRSQCLDKDLELDLEGILVAGLEEKPRAGQGFGIGSGRHS